MRWRLAADSMSVWVRGRIGCCKWTSRTLVPAGSCSPLGFKNSSERLRMQSSFGWISAFNMQTTSKWFHICRDGAEVLTASLVQPSPNPNPRRYENRRRRKGSWFQADRSLKLSVSAGKATKVRFFCLLEDLGFVLFYVWSFFCSEAHFGHCDGSWAGGPQRPPAVSLLWSQMCKINIVFIF